MAWLLSENSKWWTHFGKRFDGEIALWFLLLYSFNRFWIEFLVIGRDVGAIKYLGLSIVQWVCLVVFVIIFLIVVYCYYLLYSRKIRDYSGLLKFRLKNKD